METGTETDIPPHINPTQTLIADTNANCGNIDRTEHKDQQCVSGEGPQNLTNLGESSEHIEDVLTSFCRNRIDSESFIKQQSLYGDLNSNAAVYGSRSFPSRISNGSKGFNLVKFITACIASQLKSLGVDDLDCKEVVDAWLSQRRQRRWNQCVYRSTTIFADKSKLASHSCLYQALQLGMANSLADNSDEVIKAVNTFSPPSEPNSSLLRLSEDGNVELGKFLTRMEEVRGHINNATCTLLQSISLLMLPYLKLLSGNQLVSTCPEIFIQDSVKVIALMGNNLKTDSLPETSQMVHREFRNLQSNSKALTKTLQKMLKKFRELFEENNTESERSLTKIHPRGLLPYQKGRISTNNTHRDQDLLFNPGTFLVDSIQFTQIPFYHANFTAGDIFRHHLLLSKSSLGCLIYKCDLEGEWKYFSELPFNKRRDLFLSVMEDLQWCLKHATSSANHVKELIKKGYPEHIFPKIRENLGYLKVTAKNPEDLLVLSKVTIVTHVNAVRDASARIIRILRDACKISKYYSKSIQSAKKDFGGGLAGFMRFQRKVDNPSPSVNTLPLKFDAAKVKLLIPFPTTMDPGDQFCVSLS